MLCAKLTAGYHAGKEADDLVLHTFSGNKKLYLPSGLLEYLEREQHVNELS